MSSPNAAVWCTYADTRGRGFLVHRLRPVIPCPHCDRPLAFDGHKSSCCGHTFKRGFGGWVSQQEPIGSHNLKEARGWAHVKPWTKERP